MKNYIIKSSIVFFMVLILGLILLPIFPHDKEYIYSNGYELLLDDEIITFNGFEGYNLELPAHDYDLILISFTLKYSNISIFTNFSIETGTYINFLGQSIPVVYITDGDLPYVGIVTGEDLGDVSVTVWGVSK